MSARKRFKVVMRWTSPSWMPFHSAAGMMRGTKSKGKMRSSPSFAVHREGDALVAQGELLEALAPLHVLLGEGLQDRDEGRVVRAGLAPRVEDLVEAGPGRDPLHGVSLGPRASRAGPPRVKAPRRRVLDWPGTCPRLRIRRTVTSRPRPSASARSAEPASLRSRWSVASDRGWSAPAVSSSST